MMLQTKICTLPCTEMELMLLQNIYTITLCQTSHVRRVILTKEVIRLIKTNFKTLITSIDAASQFMEQLQVVNQFVKDVTTSTLHHDPYPQILSNTPGTIRVVQVLYTNTFNSAIFKYNPYSSTQKQHNAYFKSNMQQQHQFLQKRLSRLLIVK